MVLCMGTVYAEGEFTAVIGTAEANPGELVDIDVVFRNNPGIIAALFSLEYDRERLSLAGVKDGKLLEGAVFGKSTEDYPYRMVWNSASTKNFTDDGILVTLTFKVKDNAPAGIAFVKLSYNKNDVFDVELSNTAVLVVDGEVAVKGKASSGSGGGYVRNPEIKEEIKKEDSFSDLAAYPWAKEAIGRLAEKNIVKGTGEGIFSPESLVSRADFAIMLTRAFEISPRDGEGFSDVDENKYYATELKTAKAAGIIQGIGNNKFNPEGKISRQDMMVMLCRALESKGYKFSAVPENVLDDYSDSKLISPYAKQAVSLAVSESFVRGNDGKISPLDYTTRAEVAVVLDRVLN